MGMEAQPITGSVWTTILGTVTVCVLFLTNDAGARQGILTMIGWFLWGGVNFTESAHNIQLENSDRGPKLTADLSKADGGSRGRQGLFLADKIENQNGNLKFTVSVTK